MNAQIAGETDEGIGVLVTDNDGVDHEIEMLFDGEVVYHDQDAYPDDPADRSNYEDEMVSQAWLYARWYVYQERGYDTLPATRNPDRIAAALMTLHGMDAEEFERLFGTFYRQARSHVDDGAERPLELEPGAPPDEVIYKQNIYLSTGLDMLQGVHQDFGDQIRDLTETIIGEMLQQGTFSALADELSEAVKQEASEYDVDLPQFGIEGVSDLYYTYYRPDDSERTVGGEDGFDRDPDVMLQILPPPADSLEEFRAHILRHLVCQIRDIYIGSGQEPPVAYRVLGLGLHQYTLKYEYFDMYPKYYDPESGIEGYTV